MNIALCRIWPLDCIMLGPRWSSGYSEPSYSKFSAKLPFIHISSTILCRVRFYDFFE